ncbi:MAG: hypothetical protein LBC79_00555 [Deltaproteobacteria bacterium]|nr:hypothetical protein [Deltaproteobacteria bacterium]
MGKDVMAMKGKQVLIPVGLLSNIADLLGCWDTSFEDASLQRSHEDVLCAVLKKLLANEIRSSYAKMIFAEDESKRLDAKLEYLKRKRYYANDILL